MLVQQRYSIGFALGYMLFEVFEYLVLKESLIVTNLLHLVLPSPKNPVLHSFATHHFNLSLCFHNLNPSGNILSQLQKNPPNLKLSYFRSNF